MWPDAATSTGTGPRHEDLPISRLHRFSERIVIGGNLAAADLSWLASQACPEIIDLRMPDEDAIGGLSFADERRLAADLGIAYHHVPITRAMCAKDAIAAVRALLRPVAARVLLHCTNGARAGALALIHLGCDAGGSLGECYTRAASLPVQPPVEAWVGYILDEPRRGLREQSPERPR